MAFFDTDFYTNGYHPKTSLSESEIKPPKCGSAESSSAANKANIELLDELYSENAKLRKKLKKVRKEKKRWKRKYLELYNYVTNEEPTMARIKAGLGIPPIKPLNEDALKPEKPIKSRVKPGSMDWLYEV